MICPSYRQDNKQVLESLRLQGMLLLACLGVTQQQAQIGGQRHARQSLEKPHWLVSHNSTTCDHDAAGGPLVLEEREVHKFRWKRKAEKRSRRLHQVFLRGDNVVTIKPVLQDVQKQWPQLVLQWLAAGIPEAAFLIPSQPATTSQGQSLPLPPGAPQCAAVAYLTPSWAHVKR